MTDKHFYAILAKNEIARAIRDSDGVNKIRLGPTVDITTYRLESLLKDIEKYVGESNQPSVQDIVNDNKKWL